MIAPVTPRHEPQPEPEPAVVVIEVGVVSVKQTASEIAHDYARQMAEAIGIPCRVLPDAEFESLQLNLFGRTTV